MYQIIGFARASFTLCHLSPALEYRQICRDSAVSPARLCYQTCSNHES